MATIKLVIAVFMPSSRGREERALFCFMKCADKVMGRRRPTASTYRADIDKVMA